MTLTQLIMDNYKSYQLIIDNGAFGIVRSRKSSHRGWVGELVGEFTHEGERYLTLMFEGGKTIRSYKVRNVDVIKPRELIKMYAQEKNKYERILDINNKLSHYLKSLEDDMSTM